MAKSHRNYYLAITNEKIVPVKTFDEAVALSNGKPGGNTKGFDSLEDAENAIPAIRKEIQRRLSKKKPKYTRSNSYQQKANMSQLIAFLPEYQREKTRLTLSCHFGGKNKESTIADSNGVTDIVPLSLGASAQLKYLELTYAALQWAERVINQGIDCVEIRGIDGSVLVTLTDWALKARERGWVNASGKPFANREVVEPMLTLFERLGNKVTMNTGEKNTRR